MEGYYLLSYSMVYPDNYKDCYKNFHKTFATLDELEDYVSRKKLVRCKYCISIYKLFISNS